MELVEFNANRLHSLVKEQAMLHGHAAADEFMQWLDSDNRWLNNLVDRIVVGVSETPPWDTEDPLAVVAEPYRLLAIQDDGGDRNILPDHPMIQWTDELQPLFLRKVRILNGLHTAMVARCLPTLHKETGRTIQPQCIKENDTVPVLQTCARSNLSITSQTTPRPEEMLVAMSIGMIA